MKKQQGSATMTVIIAVMILSVLGGMLAVLTSENVKMAANFQNRITAQYAAESGARTAVAMFAATTPNWNVLSAEAEMRNSPGVYYKVTITPALTGSQLPVPGTKYEVRATGRYKRAENSVRFDAVVDEETLELKISSWR
jgi:type II secretory pathway component PulK